MQSPTDLSLSVATVPFLSALALINCLNRHSTEWGQLSEEVFRGDRLPVLPFPHDVVPPAEDGATNR